MPGSLKAKFKSFAYRQLNLAGRSNDDALTYALSLEFIQEVRVPQQPNKNYTDCGCYLISFARVIMDTIRRTVSTTGENVKFTFFDEESTRTNAEVVEQWIEDAGEIAPNEIRKDIRREIDRRQ
jgi:hypothetical protein